MSHDIRARIDELFDRALDLPPGERYRFIQEVAAAEPDLEEELAELLRLASEPEHHDRWTVASESLWVELAHEADANADPSGTRIGAWRVLDEIGRGGMGTVYMAERADGEFEQRAALKLLRPGIATDDALRRFEQERQILAGLTHSGIARLLDGGRTPDGQPYLVMECVEGAPIDRYCRERALTVPDRLRIFLKVCQAVDHAHRNMVVHRDLKPSNIIVTAMGEVKLLDFGIAKLLQAAVGGTTPALPAMTRTVSRVLTPEYASPEQIQGRAITVASDVYQLSLLLSELLTGRRPYDLGEASPMEIEKKVCIEPAPRPSTLVGSDRALARQLRGDLDSIVQQGLRKEPERRYTSVERLADDVQRHLDGQPVVARGDTLTYRAGSFVRRHRLGVAAASVVVVVVLGWAVSATLQARAIARERDRAREEAAKAEQVKGFVLRLFQNADPTAPRGAPLTARELLDRGWESIQSELVGQPAVQAEILDTVGHIYRELGAYDRAEPLLTRGLEVARTLDDGNHVLVSTALRSNGRLRRERGNFDGAEQALTEALDRQRRLYGQDHAEVASTLNDLGVTLYSRGDYTRAMPMFRQALEMRRRLLGDEHTDVAESLDRLGMALHNLGDYKSAEPLLRQGLDLRRRLLPPNHPELATSLSDLALVTQSLGNLKEAEALHRESVEVMIRVRGESHPYVAVTMNNLARLLRTTGDLDEAEALLRKALVIRRAALGDRHPQVALNLNDLGRLLYDKNEHIEAERFYREALVTYPDGHPWRSATVFNLGRVLEDRKDYAGAEQSYREALAAQRVQYGEDHERVGMDLRQLGIVLYRQGRLAEAETNLRLALEIFRKRLPDGHVRMAEALVPLGQLLLDRGEAKAAEPILREAVAIQDKAFGKEDPRSVEASRTLDRALALQARGRPPT